MDEKQPSSSWDDLIKKIGAAPAPDALERKRPAIETTFEPPPAIDASAIKPKPGDWNALADKLGIEVPEPAEPPRKASRQAARESEHGGPSSEALEASLAEIEPMESMFEEILEEEVSDVEFEADDDSDLEEEDSDLADDDSDLTDEVDDDGDESETLSGEAARNAFEALFQAGSFSALPPMKKPPTAREPREPHQGPQWREPEDKSREDFDERSEFDEPAPAEGAEGEEPTGTDEQGRPRRRRRRRGRGRGGEGRSERPAGRATPTRAEDEAEEWPGAPLGEEGGDEEGEREGEVAGEGDEGEKSMRRRRPRRRRRRGGVGESADAAPTRAAANGRSSAPETDEDDQEEEDDLADLTAGGPEAADEDDDDDLPRESHKNIPTWSEAISVMVETNMQSRKNSPSRPSGPRERGRGRGRGRGGSGGRRGKP